MTREEYYDTIKTLWESVNKDNIQEIIDYNRYREQLRKQIEFSYSDEAEHEDFEDEEYD